MVKSPRFKFKTMMIIKSSIVVNSIFLIKLQVATFLLVSKKEKYVSSYIMVLNS